MKHCAQNRGRLAGIPDSPRIAIGRAPRLRHHLVLESPVESNRGARLQSQLGQSAARASAPRLAVRRFGNDQQSPERQQGAAHSAATAGEPNERAVTTSNACRRAVLTGRTPRHGNGRRDPVPFEQTVDGRLQERSPSLIGIEQGHGARRPAQGQNRDPEHPRRCRGRRADSGGRSAQPRHSRRSRAHARSGRSIGIQPRNPIRAASWRTGSRESGILLRSSTTPSWSGGPFTRSRPDMASTPGSDRSWLTVHEEERTSETQRKVAPG